MADTKYKFYEDRGCGADVDPFHPELGKCRPNHHCLTCYKWLLAHPGKILNLNRGDKGIWSFGDSITHGASTVAALDTETAKELHRMKLATVARFLRLALDTEIMRDWSPEEREGRRREWVCEALEITRTIIGE